MKASENTLESLVDIDRVETTGQVRRIGAQMLLALARKEIPRDDVVAAGKMIDAMANSMQAEVRLAMSAVLLREKGGDLGRVESMGQNKID